MAACYGPEATFTDPVFVSLDARETGGMWRMLTSQASDLHIELLDHSADERHGTAHWQAKYTFSQTGRPVLNDVRSDFIFNDGLITEQTDRFDFYRWARQALGLRGALLGFTPLVRTAVRTRARSSLEQFLTTEG